MKHASLALFAALSSFGCASPDRVPPSASPNERPAAPATSSSTKSADSPAGSSPHPEASTSASESATAPPADKRRFDCRGRSLSLQGIWVEECQTAEKPPDTGEPPNIELFIGASDSYVSGEEADVGVYITNRSGNEQELVFQHQCLGLKAHQMFDLIVKNSRGATAALEQYKPRVGLLASLNTGAARAGEVHRRSNSSARPGSTLEGDIPARGDEALTMKRLLPPFVLSFMSNCAAGQPSAPPANAPPKAPAASTSARTSTCEGPALTLESPRVRAAARSSLSVPGSGERFTICCREWP